jgi:tetratricopeptide (TPR) repeat protein
MRTLTVISEEIGRTPPFSWEELGSLARELGEWSVFVDVLLNRGILLADEPAAGSLAILDEAATTAEARGLNEQLAWIEYVRAEALTVIGRLDGAISACERALAIADANAYRRAAVRTYHALVPLAGMRGDPGPAGRVEAFYAQHEGAFPDSGYSRIMRASMELAIARATHRKVGPPAAEPRMAALESPLQSATWILAVETVVGSWIAAGWLDEADEALRHLAIAAESRETSALGRGSVEFLSGEVLRARGDAAGAHSRARAALDRFRAVPAPLWTLKALTAIAAMGRASPDELHEVAALRGQLGIA